MKQTRCRSHGRAEQRQARRGEAGKRARQRRQRTAAARGHPGWTRGSCGQRATSISASVSACARSCGWCGAGVGPHVVVGSGPAWTAFAPACLLRVPIAARQRRGSEAASGTAECARRTCLRLRLRPVRRRLLLAPRLGAERALVQLPERAALAAERQLCQLRRARAEHRRLPPGQPRLAARAVSAGRCNSPGPCQPR